MAKNSLSLALVALAGASLPSAALAQTYSFHASEAAFDAMYDATPISVSGTVVASDGSPISNATVRVLAWGSGEANAGRIATTNASGAFTLTGLLRRNVLLDVSAPGRYREIVPVDLNRPIAQSTQSTGAIALTDASPKRVRLLFAGDTMMGRRFVDTNGDGVEGGAGDLIRVGSRVADAQSIFAYVRDAISAADYAVVNLETPITASPTTPHPYKSYAFYSHPDTLAGLTFAGIDAVSLGNNHIFDMLKAGVTDSMLHVSKAGLDWAGAGTSQSLAQGTTIFRALNGVPLSLQGFSHMVTDGSTDPDYQLIARDPEKAGALHASSANMTSFLAEEVPAGRFAIPMLHIGTEYSYYPSNVTRSAYVSLAQQGAGIIIGHHTHTTQGVGLVNAGGAPRFVLSSLGNFVFDQDIFETHQSFLAIADVDVLPGGGYDVARLQLVPIYIEGYVPKLFAGDELSRAGRHFGHLSSTMPTTPSGSSVADGLYGAVVFPSGHRVVALRSPSQYTTTTSSETLKVATPKGTSTTDRKSVV